MLDLEVNDESNPTAFTYSTNTKWAGFFTGSGDGTKYFDTETVGSTTYVTQKDNTLTTAAAKEAFGKEAAKYVSDNNIAADATEVTAANDTAQFTGLDDGYYLITSTLGTAATIISSPGTAVADIKEKNTTPSVDKQVKEQDERNTTGDTSSWGASNDDQIGKTVEFKSKVTINKNAKKVVYHDTMSTGLTWDSDSVKIYSDSALETQVANASNANWTVADASSNSETFTITFTQTYLDSLTDAMTDESTSSTDIYVYYTATLNENAKLAGETNKAQVTYGEAGKTEEVTTTTYTRQFQVQKYDSSDATETPIAGAKFKVYTVETDGTALKLAQNNTTKTTYRVYSDEVPEGYTATSDDKIETVAGTNITIEGVDSDDYYLEETDHPDGYQSISGRTKVSVGDDGANVTVAKIPNTKGNKLPETGGRGTTLFYVIGGLVVAAAAVLLISKRRKA